MKVFVRQVGQLEFVVETAIVEVHGLKRRHFGDISGCFGALEMNLPLIQTRKIPDLPSREVGGVSADTLVAADIDDLAVLL